MKQNLRGNIKPRNVVANLFNLSMLIIVVAAIFSALTQTMFTQRVSAACAANPTTYGVVTGSFTVSQTGTFRVWSRIQPNSSIPANNSYILEIDDTVCGIVVGDATIPANTWTWVDYRDGNTSSKINLSLAAGSHTYKIYGREDGVLLDNLVFASDSSCVPTGTGSNCSGGSTNTCSVKQGDANNDNAVNILDISLILSNYGQTNSSSCADVTKDGSINIQDISIVLSKYGT